MQNTNYSDIILHVPHASTALPTEYFAVKSEFAPGRTLLAEDSFNLVDYYTDELFIPIKPRPHIHSIKAPLCRTLCDMERMQEDPLEARNLGILFGGRKKRDDEYWITEEADSKLRQLYADYHIVASMKIDSLYRPLILDCHSFSNNATILCNMPIAHQCIDICIGFNDDSTRPNDATIQAALNYFEGKGYKVGINVPFCNAKTFVCNRRYHSLMIEVNKRLYMYEDTLEKKSGEFESLQEDLQGLYSLFDVDIRS